MKKNTDVLELDKYMTIESVDETGLAWLNPVQEPFKLFGLGYFQQDKAFRRLPLNPDPPLREAVEVLSNHTAGGQVKFKTDSIRIAVKVKLLGPPTMDHISATGSSGFDLYMNDGNLNQIFVGVTRFGRQDDAYSYEFNNFDDRRMREFTLNLPLYNGIREFSIGIEQDASLLPPSPFVDDRKIVVYGTSIAQGGCASRPGMCYTNILSRKLNRQFINLGFSGNGEGDPEVATHISRLENIAMFILDYEANCVSPEKLTETLPEFIRILRERHPETPILVISKVPFAKELFMRSVKDYRMACKEVEKETVKRCRDAGDKNIYSIDAGLFQGEDFWECTVDCIHPTDLGFYRMAENMLPEIKKYLV